MRNFSKSTNEFDNALGRLLGPRSFQRYYPGYLAHVEDIGWGLQVEAKSWILERKRIDIPLVVLVVA